MPRRRQQQRQPAPLGSLAGAASRRRRSSLNFQLSTRRMASLGLAQRLGRARRLLARKLSPSINLPDRAPRRRSARRIVALPSDPAGAQQVPRAPAGEPVVSWAGRRGRAAPSSGRRPLRGAHPLGLCVRPRGLGRKLAGAPQLLAPPQEGMRAPRWSPARPHTCAHLGRAGSPSQRRHTRIAPARSTGATELMLASDLLLDKRQPAPGPSHRFVVVVVVWYRAPVNSEVERTNQLRAGRAQSLEPLQLSSATEASWWW